MSTVTVNFIGVCTHLRNVPIIPPDDALSPAVLGLGEYHRVVMVNARFGARFGDHGVPPHVQHLYIPDEFIVDAPDDIPGLIEIPLPEQGTYWSMEGVHLHVAHAKPNLTATDAFNLIPSLTNVSGERSLQLDGKMVLNGRAACEFNIYAGTLDAYQIKDSRAIVAKLTVTSADDEPSLMVKRVWDQAPSSIRLRDGAHVFLLNIGEETDREADFLLHYFVTTWTPPTGAIPHPPFPNLREATHEDGLYHLSRLPSGLTLGCSNSNYP